MMGNDGGRGILQKPNSGIILGQTLKRPVFDFHKYCKGTSPAYTKKKYDALGSGGEDHFRGHLLFYDETHNR